MACFILRHAVAATSNSLSFSACWAIRRVSLDREFASKEARKDGRESNLGVAWKLKVLAIIDARGTGEQPFFNGIWDVQPQSLSPNETILGNVIWQGGDSC